MFLTNPALRDVRYQEIPILALYQVVRGSSLAYASVAGMKVTGIAAVILEEKVKIRGQLGPFGRVIVSLALTRELMQNEMAATSF